MSIFDKLRKSATKAVDQHGDKITRGLDKAAKTVDERTGHKHSHQIRHGVSKAKEGLRNLEDRDRGDGSPPGSTPPESGPKGPPGSNPPK